MAHNDETLRQSFDRAVAANPDLTAADAALLAATRQIADALDAARVLHEAGESSLATYQKALYMMPHFTALLKELVMTPTARHAVEKKQRTTGGTVSRLRLAEQERKAS